MLTPLLDNMHSVITFCLLISMVIVCYAVLNFDISPCTNVGNQIVIRTTALQLKHYNMQVSSVNLHHVLQTITVILLQTLLNLATYHFYKLEKVMSMKF